MPEIPPQILALAQLGGCVVLSLFFGWVVLRLLADFRAELKDQAERCRKDHRAIVRALRAVAREVRQRPFDDLQP